MKEVAISQVHSHEHGTCILAAFIKYRIGRYTYQHLQYKYYITVSKTGVYIESFNLESRLTVFS